MEKTLRSCADQIVEASIRAVLPDEAVRRALKDFHPEGRTVLVAAGKAAWQMAHAAVAVLGHVDGGVVVTKYDHVKGKIPGVTCCEAGHPVPDANSFAATQKALELVQGLQPEDTVLFLLSGGGSALFEQPLVPGAELQDITSQLLASGAEKAEILCETVYGKVRPEVPASILQFHPNTKLFLDEAAYRVIRAGKRGETHV